MMKRSLRLLEQQLVYVCAPTGILPDQVMQTVQYLQENNMVAVILPMVYQSLQTAESETNRRAIIEKSDLVFAMPGATECPVSKKELEFARATNKIILTQAA